MKVCLEIYIYIIPMISIVLFFRIRIVLNQTALCECEIQDTLQRIAIEPQFHLTAIYLTLRVP